jgi:hypothetical protein
MAGNERGALVDEHAVTDPEFPTLLRAYLDSCGQRAEGDPTQ